jgi:hypothetical protein
VELNGAAGCREEVPEETRTGARRDAIAEHEQKKYRIQRSEGEGTILCTYDYMTGKALNGVPWLSLTTISGTESNGGAQNTHSSPCNSHTMLLSTHANMSVYQPFTLYKRTIQFSEVNASSNRSKRTCTTEMQWNMG